MTPAILEVQKILAAGLREFKNAGEHPEGFALTAVCAILDAGIDVEWSATHGLRQEETPARAVDDNTTNDTKEA